MKTSYTIIKWKIEGTQYTFDDIEEAKLKFQEMGRLLKSNERLETTQTDSETRVIDLLTPSPSENNK